jgi:hypothetical protein
MIGGLILVATPLAIVFWICAGPTIKSRLRRLNRAEEDAIARARDLLNR